MSRPSRRRRPSAGWPTGTRWWRCSAGRSACRSRTPPSSRATRTASPTISAASSRSTSWRPSRSRKKLARSISPRSWPTGWPTAERSAALSRFRRALCRKALAAIEQCGLRRFHRRAGADRAQQGRVAPLAAGLLSAVTDDGPATSSLFDELLGVLDRFLNERAGAAMPCARRSATSCHRCSTVSRRRLSAEEDRRVDDGVHRRGAGRSRPSAARGIRQFRQGLRRAAAQLEAIRRSAPRS